MRLWHKDLIPVLPRQQLLGQWRELCAIMRNIEEKVTPNHVLVNRVMDYEPEELYKYAILVYQGMRCRGYRCNFVKFHDAYHRKFGGNLNFMAYEALFGPFTNERLYYDAFADWMNDRYLRQNYYNLEEKHDCGAISDEDFARIRKVCARVLP